MGVNQPGSKRTARAFKKYICCQGSRMRMLAIPFYTYFSFLFSYFALPFFQDLFLLLPVTFFTFPSIVSPPAPTWSA